MKATVVLIFLLVATWLYVISLPPTEIKLFIDKFGFSTNNLLSGAWWVLITSSLLHVSVTHLASNIFVLFFFGSAVEKEIGSLKMLGVFFTGAILGDLLSMLVYTPNSIAIGASGGIFALIGAGMLIRPIDLSFYPFFVPIPLSLLGMGYCLYTVIGFFGGGDPHVSYVAHIGGLFVGLLYGFRKEGAEQGIRIIIAMFLILILFPSIWYYYSKAFSALISLI